MIESLFGLESYDCVFLSILLAFFLTCISLKLFMNKLPRDGGRKYAIHGELSKGKPRGAGIIFIIIFAILTLLFIPFRVETLIYLILIVCAMISGYLDDRSSTPWGEYLKGIIDLVIAVSTAYTFYNYNGSDITIQMLQIHVTIPPALFILLATILIWASINVTNCSDGVDGLCGTLSLTTLVSIFIFLEKFNSGSDFVFIILIFVSCLLGYLWYNATPSYLLMGDAGSRAIGLFIAIAILSTKSPIAYIPLSIVLILDGGLGLVKVTLLRFFKIHILKNTLTPLHDDLRKRRGWSDTQVVFRLTIIQTVISFIYLFAITAI